jgi:hypothetical protein
MRRILPAALAGLVALSACATEESPVPSATGSVPTIAATPSPTAASTTDATEPARSPSATPEPSLSIDLPDGTDPRTVTVDVAPNVGAEGGELVVTVTSQAADRIDELVLRWPTELNDALFLAPFVPSEERIREGGPPLVQTWTKWVIGPGEQGEPEGTISLGYGPLLPGATLTMALNATRLAEGPIGFDLQVLAGNDLLTLAGGEPAKVRVEVP